MVNALGDLPWQILSTGAQLARDGAGGLLVTDERGGAYQMAADLPADGVRGYGVVADVEIIEGGVTIGGLAGADGRWLASESAGTAGRHRISVYLPARGADAVRLVVANFRFGGGPSRIRFERFTVTVIAPPDAPPDTDTDADDPLARLRAAAADARLAEAWRDGTLAPERMRALSSVVWTTYGAATTWTPRAESAEGAGELVTDERPFAYQVGTEIALPDGAAGVGVEADVHVLEGAITIGAISAAQDRWLGTRSLPAGRHAVRFFVPARGEAAVRIVIANERPAGGRSRAAVESLRVVTIGAEAGATDGAAPAPSGAPGPRDARGRER
jgi:hypothetical protein